MKNDTPALFGKVLRACGLTATGLFLFQVSPAQTAPADKDETLQLERYVVTGSNLPTAGETPASPVTLLTPQIIAQSGVASDLLQVIRKVAPQFTGNANLGGDNGNISSGLTNGGSSLALRNAATLVLVNGRRLASAPVGATGGNVFVDVNAIPLAAIERVEILTDGASAIYGSDAVSGVVNIILKSDFQGAEIGGRYAFTRNQGHYEEKSAYGVVGGRFGENGPKVTASYEWVKTDPVFNYERPFATPVYGTTNFAGAIQVGAYDADGNFTGDPNGYYFLDPSLNAPKAGATLAERGYTGPYNTGEILRFYDLARYTTMILANEKKIGTFSLEGRFSDQLRYFGDLLYSSTDTVSQLNAQPLTIRLTAADPANVLGRDVSVRNRFVDYPRTYSAVTDSFRGIFGLKGSLADHWTWDGAADYSQGVQDFANGGLVRTAARIAAVAAGKINLFNRTQASGALDGVFGAAAGKFKSTLVSADLKLVGTDLLKLPGGSISLAAGLEVRSEKLTAEADIDSQSATFAYDSGTTIDPFNQKRDVKSAFAEVRIPLVGPENRRPGIHTAELTVAVRHERYSDTDDPTVPKIALRYQPVDDSLLFRATFSKSFAAPTLYELNSPVAIGFTPPLAEFDTNQAGLVTTAVTSLAPSRSTNYSAGIVWSPKALPDFLVSVDYFNIKQSEVISSYFTSGVVDQVFHDVEVNGGNSPYASLIHISSATGPTISAPGQVSLLGLDNLYLVVPAASNLGTAKLSGFDTRLEYTWKLDAGGKLRFASTGSYYLNYDIQVAPGAPFTPTAGLVTGLNGTIPRWRLYNQVSWESGGWTVDLGQTFYSATTDTIWTTDYLPDYQQRIPAYSTYDASVSYDWKAGWRRLKGMKLSVGVNNFTNRMPTKSATFDSLSNADITEFNPIGRLYYISASTRF
ncbi:MAG TPA: TonB-dependent receptor [Lacunisphaera sp.]